MHQREKNEPAMGRVERAERLRARQCRVTQILVQRARHQGDHSYILTLPYTPNSRY